MRLIGKHGEITTGHTESTAVVTNSILEKKYGSVVVFDNSELTKWIKRLKIQGTDDGSIKFGEW